MKQRLCVACLFFLALLSGCSVLGGNGASDEVDYAHLDKTIIAAEQAYSAGNFDEAERLFKEASSLNPASSQATYRLGTIAYRRNELANAAEYFEKTIKIDPRLSKAHFNLATIRLMQAQSHFKYYIATVDPKTDIERLSGLIGAIEEYASSEKNK